MNQLAAVVVGRRWLEPRSELAFATRSLAGAASRCGPVAVLVPGDLRQLEPDGAFDLQGLGFVEGLQWPDALPNDRPVIVDELTSEIAALLARTGATSVLFLSATTGSPQPGWQRIELVDPDHPVPLHVPVNRLAERHRHHGFGFTDYLLVLGDRAGRQADPPPAAAWLCSAFTEADVVVVEDAVASAWKGRALRGSVSVDTRMDLWRLIAHAKVCVDLAPGAAIARECIESLRFGTPIIVPERSGPAEVHALSGGGSIFGDPDELLTAVRHLQRSSRRAEASLAGRRYADDRYGDTTALIGQMRELLDAERSA